MAKIFLNGLALGGYRSFGKKIQRMGPFGSINLFAGPNNCGKSNILRFVQFHLSKLKTQNTPFNGKIEWRPGEKNRVTESLTVGIGYCITDEILSTIANGNVNWVSALKSVLCLEEFNESDGVSWVELKSGGNPTEMTTGWNFAEMSSRVTIASNVMQDLWSYLRGGNVRGGDRPGWLSDIIQKLIPSRMLLPDVFTVPDFRRIERSGDENNENIIDGSGLIQKLAKLEQYSPDRPHDGERFEKIQRFVRNIVGDSRTKLRIPHDRDTIAVSMNGIDLNLESLGTGIHQTILLAAMGTVVENSIVCLEEPETHLHPIFQRKLLRYLNSETTNQYFIATHSAHLLDCAITDTGGVAFRVRLDGGATIVERVTSGEIQAGVCKDLGYHASDLVQSNCIIWVEGPSDRIYLKWWIAAMDQSLVEGIHFSIMFYGGVLLCYLTGDDEVGSEEFEEFVALRRLNRNALIVMDSDKDRDDTPIGEHKLKVIEQFKKDGLTWITEGRTIENYLSKKAQKEAFLATHPNSESKFGGGNQYSVVKKGGKFAKIRMAKKAASSSADLTVLDLNDRVQQVVAFVRRCNPERTGKPMQSEEQDRE